MSECRVAPNVFMRMKETVIKSRCGPHQHLQQSPCTCRGERERVFGAETAAQMAPLPCFGRLGEVRFFPSVQPTGDRRTTRRMSRGATARGQIGGPRPRLQLRPHVLRRFIISRSEELYPGLQVVFHTPLGFISQQFPLEALTNTTSTLQQSTRARYGHVPD